MLSSTVAVLIAIELSLADKLEILQRLDRYRRWRSLDEKRYCLACGKVIDGHNIQIVGGARGTGPMRLVCPTRRCHSIDGLGVADRRSDEEVFGR